MSGWQEPSPAPSPKMFMLLKTLALIFHLLHSDSDKLHGYMTPHTRGKSAHAGSARDIVRALIHAASDMTCPVPHRTKKY